MSDWDSDSEEETTTKSSPTKAEATKPKATSNWDDSDSDDDDANQTKNEPKSGSSAASSPAKSKVVDEWESEEEEPQDDGIANGTAKSEDTEKSDPFADAEKLKKLAKQMEKKNKAKARRKANKQKKKQQSQDLRKQQQQSKKSKKQKSKSKSEDSSSSSDSSSDDDAKPKSNNKNKKGMQSYDDRMATDNDILFKGHDAAKKAMNAPNKKKEEEKVDDRVMLSGEVTLKNFPLGSSKDVEKLADEISGILDQKLFEEAINARDIYLFYNKLLSADILKHLDMVDTKAISQKATGLLKTKQKEWQKKKNPSLVIYVESIVAYNHVVTVVVLLLLYPCTKYVCVKRERRRRNRNGLCLINSDQPHIRKISTIEMDSMMQESMTCLTEESVIVHCLWF